MWSTVYSDYVLDLVQTNKDDYPYYLAFTNTVTGSGYSYNTPSFYVYFSKNPISAKTLYTYVFEGDTIVYSVIGGSASNYSTDERVEVSRFQRSNLEINQYEFIYSNADYSSVVGCQPDILTRDAIDTNSFNSVSIVLTIILIAVLFYKLMRR